MLRLPAYNRDIPFLQRKGHRAGHLFLSALDEGIESLTQRREPEAEINQFGIFQSDVLLKMRDIAFEAQCLQLAVRRNQQRASRSFVTAARLDAAHSFLDYIH